MAGVLSTLDALVDNTVDELLEAAILFNSQILHTHVLNQNTHVDRFWCLISKYTEYDNIFIN